MNCLKKMMLATMLLSASSAYAKADLIGTTVDLSVYYPTTSDLYGDFGKQVVNPTASWTMYFGETSTVSANQIVFTVPTNTIDMFGTVSGPNGFNGVYYDFTNTGDLITSVTLNSSETTLSGFTSSDVTFGSDGRGGQIVTINVAGLSFVTGNQVVLDVVAPDISATPLPAQWVMLVEAAIVLAVGFVVRKRTMGVDHPSLC